jgi:hypothetical protein
MDTRRLLIGEGHIQYDSNSYAEDLPYWITVLEDGKTSLNKPHLVIPYTLTESDLLYFEDNGYNNGAQFCQHLKSTLKELYDDASHTNGLKLMTIALHCRFARPGYIQGISDFIDYIHNYYNTSKTDVWLCTREQIASYWYQYHYPIGAGEPVKPWYMAQNNNQKGTTSLSTLESIMTTKQNQHNFNQQRSSSSNIDIVLKPPEEELGENDII